MTAPVIFVDTETMGLDPDHNPIWEVALILPDGTEYERQIEVYPREIALAHPKALEISGFHERYNPARTISRQSLACDLYRLIPERCHLAGAVVSFDEERLRRLMWSAGMAPTWHYHLIDVEALAVGKIGMPPPWDSTELSKAVGVNPDDFSPKHTALADAHWAKAIYEAVMGQ